MITVSELRIGNWVKDPDGDYCQIEELYPFLYGCAFRWEWVKHITGIPLTPELLDKTQFFFDEITWTAGPLILGESEEGFTYWIGYVSNGSCGTIQYLHQLQNLYFALTGRELTVNL